MDVEAAGRGRVDHRQRGLHLSPVELTDGLVVGDLHRHLGALADRDGLGDGLDEPRPFVAHVGRVEPAARRDRLGEAHNLVGLGVRAGRIDEPRGEAERAFVHALRDHLAHRPQLGLRRRPSAMPITAQRTLPWGMSRRR